MRQKGANVADNSNKPPATSECSRNKLNLLFVNILNNTYATVTFQLIRQKSSQVVAKIRNRVSVNCPPTGYEDVMHKLPTGPTISKAESLPWNGIAQ